MLNGNEENFNSCFAADLIEIALSLSALNMMLVLGFSYVSFILLR